MKKVMLALILLAAVTVAAVPLSANAEGLSAAQQKILKSTGVPVYPGSTYTTGDNEIGTVLWFSTTDSPDKIMAWYEKKLSGWSVLVLNGSKVVYKGPKGMVAKDLSSKPYIFAEAKHEIPDDTEVEITIRIPK